MKMLDEGDCVLKQGYLKKIKTMKKKFFVLYRDSRIGPARLEYYDSEKKFREKKGGQSARRAILLRSCFAISETCDSRQKHGIALYTKDDCFGVGFDDERERDDWLAAMHSLVGGRRGDSRTPMFEHVWNVNVRPKNLGKNFTGQYRLCLTVRNVSLVKKASVEPDITFPLEVVRRCGHSDNFFFIEVGRQASTGEGELWIEAEDALIAQNIHYAILLAMNATKEDDDGLRLLPHQCGQPVAVSGAILTSTGAPQRSNSHSTDSRQSFIQSRGAYDIARGSCRPQRSYTFSEPKRSAAAAGAGITSRGACGQGGYMLNTKQSHRPISAAGGSFLGQDLLDRCGSSFYQRMRSDSISSRATTSSSVSIDECDQGLPSRSLTPDLQPGLCLPQPFSVGPSYQGGGDVPAATDRRSPNFGCSMLPLQLSRGGPGPAFEHQKTNTSSSASSLSGSSLDDSYLDMTPGCVSARARSSATTEASAYVDMAPYSIRDSHVAITSPTSLKNQEGYVEMNPAVLSASEGNRSSGPAPTRVTRPDTVRSYLRDSGSEEAMERTPSRRASITGQSCATAAGPTASCSPYVEMSGASGKPSLQSSAAAAAAAQGHTGVMPRSYMLAGAAHSSDSASSSPRGAFASWQEKGGDACSHGSTASLHEGSVCSSRSNPQSPRVVTPDLWHPPVACPSSSSQQADLFMEMDFDRPRTASDTFSNRPRTHSLSSHRPRSSSHGQSSKRKTPRTIMAPSTVAPASSAGSSRDSASSSLLGSANYLEMAPGQNGSRVDYMDMTFDDKKSQKGRHLKHKAGMSQLTVSTAYYSATRSSSSQESLEGTTRGLPAAPPLSPGDYVGIDFSKGFEQRVDKAGDSAAISPILLKGSQQEPCWNVAEPFPELSGSSSGEDIHSCRPLLQQRQLPSSSHVRSTSSVARTPRSQPPSSAQLPETTDKSVLLRAAASGNAKGRTTSVHVANRSECDPKLAPCNPRGAMVESPRNTQSGCSAVEPDGYTEMGPGALGSGFGITSSSCSVTRGSSAVNDSLNSESGTIKSVEDDYGDAYTTMCFDYGGEVLAPKKGVCYVRQTSQDSCLCVPKPSVCYIRLETQPDEAADLAAQLCDERVLADDSKECGNSSTPRDCECRGGDASIVPPAGLSCRGFGILPGSSELPNAGTKEAQQDCSGECAATLVLLESCGADRQQCPNVAAVQCDRCSELEGCTDSVAVGLSGEVAKCTDADLVDPFALMTIAADANRHTVP